MIFSWASCAWRNFRSQMSSVREAESTRREVIPSRTSARTELSATGRKSSCSQTWGRYIVEDIKRGTKPAGEAQELYRWLLRMAVTRDERITALASKYLDLPDILAIRKRMIGTGLIGGEAVGMLLAPPPPCPAGGEWGG